MDEGRGVQVIRRAVVDAPPGKLVVEWTLHPEPDPEWPQFLSADGKSGTAEFVRQEPRVMGNKLTMTIPEQDLESATTWVDKAIANANQAFAVNVLRPRQRKAAEKQEAEVARRQRIMEANERLNRGRP
ncbi:MAG TPA: hypothetical protein VKV02_09085 [Acidobacteriaceae bacterium]|nr:hypothetical protein [Acidobacteriaceae bacterium]